MIQVIAQQQPNIVFFIADDAGFLDNSVYGSGEVKTPVMEMLAKKGMRFNNAFVASPACAPSRAALLTGLMPARNGAEANHTYPTENITVLTTLLQQAGYEVIAFGKVAHDKMNETSGFDFFSQPRINLAKNIRDYFTTHKSTKPVCLLVGDRRPHVPWIKNATYDPDKIKLPAYFIDTKEARLEMARYYTDVSAMDQEMGEVYKIAEQQFADNFIFMYSSDHGAQWPFAKWNLYDLGIRTPLLISWKNKIKAGSVSNALISWVDIFPTLLDVSGTKVPSNIDGKSFANIFFEKTKMFRDNIYTTHSGDGVMNAYPMRSVRTTKYHYIINLHSEYLHTNHSDLLKKDGAGSFWQQWYELAKTNQAAMEIVQKYHRRPAMELYDIEHDPLQQKNLAYDKKYQQIVAAMDKDLREWMKLQGDKEKLYNEPVMKIKEVEIK